MTARFDLTDAQWATLEPLLPKGKKPGRPPTWTKRRLINGIRWRTRVRVALARRARLLRALADRLRAVSPLAARRHLAGDPDLACEQGRKPLVVLITAGQRGDSPRFAAVIERIRVPRPGPGRPRTRPDRVLADKAYSSKRNRAYLRRRGIRATIPVKDDQAAQHRGVATRFDKLAVRYEATIVEPYPRPGFSAEAVQPAARVNVTCVTPLGEEVASTW